MSKAPDQTMDGVWIAVWSMLAGAVMVTACFCLPISQILTGPPGTAGGAVIMLVSIGPCTVVGGVAVGLVASAYLVPLLYGTRLERSLLAVLSPSVPIAMVISELALPTQGVLGGALSQAAIAGVVRGREWFRKAPRGRTLCTNCGFDCTGVRAEWCPECGFGGPEWAARNPMLCAVCGKGRTSEGVCEECGARDFNAGDWRRPANSGNDARLPRA